MSNLQGPSLQEEIMMPVAARGGCEVATGIDGGIEAGDRPRRAIQTSAISRRKKKYFQPPEVPNLNLDISEVDEHKRQRRASAGSPGQQTPRS